MQFRKCAILQKKELHTTTADILSFFCHNARIELVSRQPDREARQFIFSFLRCLRSEVSTQGPISLIEESETEEADGSESKAGTTEPVPTSSGPSIVSVLNSPSSVIDDVSTQGPISRIADSRRSETEKAEGSESKTGTTQPVPGTSSGQSIVSVLNPSSSVKDDVAPISYNLFLQVVGVFTRIES